MVHVQFVAQTVLSVVEYQSCAVPHLCRTVAGNVGWGGEGGLGLSDVSDMACMRCCCVQTDM